MNILQISHKPIYPPIDGGSIAMYNLFRGLTDNGCNVDVLSMNTYKQYCNIKKVPQDFLDLSKYTLIDVDIKIKIIPALLNIFSASSYNTNRFNSKLFETTLLQILRNKDYEFVVLESLYSTNNLDLIRKNSKAKIILRSHNVEYKIWENLANNENKIIKKWYLNLLAKRLKSYEVETLSKVDLIASISTDDNLIFKNEQIRTPMIHIPFGINFNDEEFKNYSIPEPNALTIFHLGSMNWIPHQKAIKWFLEKVWIKINRIYPNIKFHLAGTEMPDWLTKSNYKNVVITNGYIDGNSYMSQKAIMVVPSFYGSGIRVKIVEGMAKGKVIITTKNGAMGINCANNVNIFISDNHEEWIDIICKCISNFDLVKNISQNARSLSEIEFDYKSSAKKLLNFFKSN
jgi:glycosyltransferase involved in cell wall biosynthesis